VIIRKSPEELDKMRRAGRIVAGTIDAVLEAVEPGRTTHDLDLVAERYIEEQGALSSFKGYKGTYRP
jgi:methionyl aminopeptidase